MWKGCSVKGAPSKDVLSRNFLTWKQKETVVVKSPGSVASLLAGREASVVLKLREESPSPQGLLETAQLLPSGRLVTSGTKFCPFGAWAALHRETGPSGSRVSGVPGGRGPAGRLRRVGGASRDPHTTRGDIRTQPLRSRTGAPQQHPRPSPPAPHSPCRRQPAASCRAAGTERRSGQLAFGTADAWTGALRPESCHLAKLRTLGASSLQLPGGTDRPPLCGEPPSLREQPRQPPRRVGVGPPGPGTSGAFSPGSQ